MGEGALRGFATSLIVADRRGLFLNGAVLSVGLTAVFGGGGDDRPSPSSAEQGDYDGEQMHSNVR